MLNVFYYPNKSVEEIEKELGVAIFNNDAFQIQKEQEEQHHLAYSCRHVFRPA